MTRDGEKVNEATLCVVGREEKEGRGRGRHVARWVFKETRGKTVFRAVFWDVESWYGTSWSAFLAPNCDRCVIVA